MADKHIHCINFLYFFKLKKLYFPTAPNSNVIDHTNVATMVLLQVFFMMSMNWTGRERPFFPKWTDNERPFIDALWNENEN